MSDSNDIVVIDQLTKRFGDFTAIDNLSLRLQRGRILGFIGPNGAGKTTTISVLVGMVHPTSGTAHIAGADCSRETQRIKQLVGYMPDVFGSYDNMRVREYLDFFGAAYQIPRADRRRRIAEVLDLTNSTWMADRFVESLSHGMKQRVSLARTMLHDPEVLILDEPANGLDPTARIEMREILLRLADAGKTLIVTSHILPELARICNQVAIITNGKLRASGSLDEIMARFRQERTIEVQLAKTDRLQQAAGLISESEHCLEAASVSEAEGVVRFRTRSREEDLGLLLKQLFAGDVIVTQFREVTTDLEDAFLSVTATSESTES